ncbi:MAG: alanine racemase [Clostridia bacterium]|nr:alanine racemase [Clostridia bacterium]
MQKIVAEIHLGNIRRNAELFKNLSGVKLCAVVKANAYGHGAEEVAFALSDVADCFAVALVDEGLQIRQAVCGKDILVFSPPITEEETYAILSNGFIVSVPNLWTAKLIVSVCQKYNLTARAHLKVNTGMNRYGMNGSMLGKVCRLLQNHSCVKVEGLYSHLYATDRETSKKQRELFCRMQGICKRYFPFATSHLSATYGATLGRDFSFDMVRIGLGLYGYTPTLADLPLQKGMSVKAQVLLNRKLSFGGVGYGEVVAKEGERIALIRGGYADGFLRKKENGAHGSERNANNLCMDVCLRESKQKRGAWTYLLTDAEETALQTNTISYEVLCALTRRAESVYDYE